MLNFLRNPRKKGFSIIELMIVIGLMAALAGILTPVFFTSGTAVRETKIQQDIGVIEKAVLTFINDTGLPYAGTDAVSISMLQQLGYISLPDSSGITYSIAVDEALSVWRDNSDYNDQTGTYRFNRVKAIQNGAELTIRVVAEDTFSGNLYADVVIFNINVSVE